MTEVKLSVRARRDLVGIRLYGNTRFGSSAADAYFLKLEAAFDLLADYPQAGPVKPELGEGIRLLTRKRHRILYRITGRDVLILRVIHHAMDTSGRVDD